MPDLDNPTPNEEELEQEEQEQEEGTGGTEAPAPKPNQEGEEEQEIENDPVEEEGEGEEEQPVSRRESKRIQSLLDKMAQFDQGRMDNRGQRPQQRRQAPVVQPGEYDEEQLNEMMYGMYERGLSEAQIVGEMRSIATNFATRLEIDAPRVNSKYTFLDKESQEFNPGVASLVNRMYLNTVGYDPNTGVVQNQDLRYGEFVEGFMEAIELVSAGKVADSTKNVAEQAARTGIRPGGSRKPAYKGSNPKQMTDEQLDAAIAAGLGM